MPRPKKRASEMTDKELVRKLFPKDVRKQLKRLVLALDATPKKKRQGKKR